MFIYVAINSDKIVFQLCS